MRRRVGLVAAVISAVALVAGPVSAADIVLLDLGEGSNGSHVVTGVCTGGPGVATDLGSITYVIKGTASGRTTDGHAVPTATGITCRVKDRQTGGTYGTVSGSLPGPSGAAVGTVRVPTSGDPYVCAVANALFSDNHTASFNNC